MISENALNAARAAYDIEAECIAEMKNYLNEEAFSNAVTLLCNAQRIGAAGCGHSGIACQHFAHLMCCIERPAKFISPAEAVHGGTGYLQKGDVMVFASRGGATKAPSALHIASAIFIVAYASSTALCATKSTPNSLAIAPKAN